MLKNQGEKIIATALDKESDNEFVKKFLSGENPHSIQFQTVPKFKAGKADATMYIGSDGKPMTEEQVALQQNVKARLCFDPPEEPKRIVPEQLDQTMRHGMLQRAETIATRASNISVREATSLEQRKAKEEAAYASFEELHAQQEEIYETKQKLDLPKQDSHFSTIHTLLFGPRPDDSSVMGDWETYDKVQQQIRKFLYHRFPGGKENQEDHAQQQLQDRLNLARDQLETQRNRIRELTTSLRSSVHEIASLKALLSDKNDELQHVKQQNSVLTVQLKHFRDASSPGAQVRRQSVSQKAQDNQELLNDFQQLVQANWQLEQENLLLRAKVSARGIDVDFSTIQRSQSMAGSVASIDLADRARRRSYLNQMLPSSSAVLRLQHSRMMWKKRQEALASVALQGHDVDANIELIRKPALDGKRRNGQNSTSPSTNAISRNDGGRTGNKISPGHARSQSAPAPQETKHDKVLGELSVDQHSPNVWSALRTRMLASVAISRADCLRRENQHIRKLRHRIAALSEELCKANSEREVSLQRADKSEKELQETQTMLTDVAGRCEKLSKILEETEEEKQRVALLPKITHDDAPSMPTKRLKSIVRRISVRRTPSDSREELQAGKQVALLGSDKDLGELVAHYQSINRQLEGKMASLNEILSKKIAALEAEVHDSKLELQSTQTKMIRDGIYYNTKATAQRGNMASPSSNSQVPSILPSPQSSSLSFKERRAVEEKAAIALRMSNPADSDLVLNDMGSDIISDVSPTAGGVPFDPNTTLPPGARKQVGARFFAVDSSNELFDHSVTKVARVEPLGRASPAPGQRMEIAAFGRISPTGHLQVPAWSQDEAHSKIKKLERELSTVSMQARKEARANAVLQVQVQVLQEQVASRMAMDDLSLTEKSARKVVPSLLRVLRRARKRIDTVVDASADQNASGDDEGLNVGEITSTADDDDHIVEQMLEIVGEASPLRHLIERQRDLKDRADSLMRNPPRGDPPVTGTNASTELRMQWLELLMVREKQLQECTTASAKHAVQQLLTETYEGMMQCEKMFSNVTGADEVIVAAVQKQATQSAASAMPQNYVEPDLADVRSSEQLERERLAQAELKRSLVELTRDIEVKRAEIIAADNVDVALSAARMSEANFNETLFVLHVSDGSSTIANIFGAYGVPSVANERVTWKKLQSGSKAVDMREQAWIPIRHSTAAHTIVDSYEEHTFYVRYTVQPTDSVASIAARFSAPQAAITGVDGSKLNSLLPPCVDISVSLEVAIQNLDLSLRGVSVFALVRNPESSVSALCRTLGIDRYSLMVWNAVPRNGTRIHIPVVITPSSLEHLKTWIAASKVILLHRVAKGETISSIARKYEVANIKIQGEPIPDSFVEVTLPTVEVFAAAVNHPMIDSAIQHPAGRTRHEIQSPIRLSELAISLGVSPLLIQLPNVDRIWTDVGQVESRIPALRIDQLKFAFQAGMQVVVATHEGQIRYVASYDEAVEALTSRSDSVHIILSQKEWNRQEALHLLHADSLSEIQPWNLTLSPDKFPHVDVIAPLQPNQYILDFVYSHKLLKLKHLSNDNFNAIIKSLQQDIIEIIGFACKPGSLKRVEIPFVSHPSLGGSVIHVQAVMSDEGSANDSRDLIIKDGSVSYLSHVHAAMLDCGLQPPSEDSPDALSLHVQESQLFVHPMFAVSFLHSVVAADTLFSLALQYGIRMSSLLAANGPTLLRARQTLTSKKGRRKIVINDDAPPLDSPPQQDISETVFEHTPLQKLKISAITIPRVPELTSVSLTTIVEECSFQQACAALGLRSTNLFVHPSSVSFNIGSLLKIPAKAAKRYVTRTGMSTLSDATLFVVEDRGDTLDSISQAFDVTRRVLTVANAVSCRLAENSILSYHPMTVAHPCFVAIHKVEEYETLHSICEAYNIAPQQLLLANPELQAIDGVEGLLTPVVPEDQEMILNSKQRNVYTLVPDVAHASIAKTFGCSVEAVARVNEMVKIPGKKLAPVVSPGAIAVARRQNLPLYVINGMTPEDTMITASTRAHCHINDVIRIGSNLKQHVTTIRVPVNAETASRVIEGNCECTVENVDTSLLPPGATIVAPGVAKLATVNDVAVVREKLQIHAQRRARFAQRLQFLDDRLEGVETRMSGVQREMFVVESAIEKQKAAGTYVETTVLVNKDDVAIQTDAVVAEIPIEEQRTTVRIPKYTRSTQTQLTGEKVEETLYSATDAQGKADLLESENSELRDNNKNLMDEVQHASEENARLRAALDKREQRLAAYVRQTAELENKVNQLKGDLKERMSQAGEDIRSPLSPQSSIRSGGYSSVLDAGLPFDSPKHQNNKGPSPALSNLNLKTPLSPALGDPKLSNVSGIESPSQRKPSQVRSSNFRDRSEDTTSGHISLLFKEPRDRGVQVDLRPPTTAKRTQTDQHEVEASSSSDSDTDEVPQRIPTPPQQQPTSPAPAQDLKPLVRVAEHSSRDNELAPKDKEKPLAIVFTDIQTSTNLWARAPEAMAEAVEAHHTEIRKLIKANLGYEVKTIGDSFMVAFSSAESAVKFALGIQTTFKSLNWNPDINKVYLDLQKENGDLGSISKDLPDDHNLWHGLRVRVGLNFGKCNIRLDPVSQGYDYYGTLVNTAARVEGVGNGGQVLITGDMYDNLKENNFDFETDIVCTPLGAHLLRGLDNAVPLFQLCPKSLHGRNFGPLRIEKANAVSDEALAASFVAAQAVPSESEERALRLQSLLAKQQEDFKKQRESFRAERRQSRAERKVSVVDASPQAPAVSKATVGTMTDHLTLSTISPLPPASARQGAGGFNRELGSAKPAVVRSPLKTIASALPALKNVRAAVDNMKALVLGDVAHYYQFVDAMLRELLGQLRNRVLIDEQEMQKIIDERVVQGVQLVSTDLSSQLQGAIVKEKLGEMLKQQAAQGLPAQQLPSQTRNDQQPSTKAERKPSTSAITPTTKANEVNDQQWLTQELAKHISQTIESGSVVAPLNEPRATMDPERKSAFENLLNVRRPSQAPHTPNSTQLNSSGRAVDAPQQTFSLTPTSRISTNAQGSPRTAQEQQQQEEQRLKQQYRDANRMSPPPSPLAGVSKSNGGALPPIGAKGMDVSTLPMRRSNVATIMNGVQGQGQGNNNNATRKQSQEYYFDRQPTPPSKPRTPPPEALDIRTDPNEARLAAVQANLAAKLLARDITKPKTPPFSPAFTPSVGSVVGGTVVTQAAQDQLARITNRVHNEVLSALRLDFAYPTGPVIHGAASESLKKLAPAFEVLNTVHRTGLKPVEVAAVKRFREEQEALRREKNILVLKRIATRLRAKRIMGNLMVEGHSIFFMQQMWKGWLAKWSNRRQNLVIRERENMERLLGLLQVQAYPPSVRGQPERDARGVPLLNVVHLDIPTTSVRPKLTASRVEPIQPPVVPSTANSTFTASNHFRFAKF